MQAVTAYQRAIRLQPNFPEAYNNLGNTLRELGRADEAIACYTACIQLQYAQQHAAGVNMTQVLHRLVPASLRVYLYLYMLHSVAYLS